MDNNTLGGALEREHREIDGGIEAFIALGKAGPGAPEPLVRAMEGLRRHIYLEEEFLFPPLRAAGMMMPILVMLREHGELWATMSQVDALLEDDGDPGDVLNACHELLAQLDRHNAKEEPVIYTRADDILGSEASAELEAFLATGVTPEGWVCAGARD